MLQEDLADCGVVVLPDPHTPYLFLFLYLEKPWLNGYVGSVSPFFVVDCEPVMFLTRETMSFFYNDSTVTPTFQLWSNSYFMLTNIVPSCSDMVIEVLEV